MQLQGPVIVRMDQRRGEDALGEVLRGGGVAAGRAGRRFRGGGDREDGASAG